MDRLLPALVIVGIVAVVFVGIALGWRARRRRQADLPAPAAVPAALGTERASADLLYVATTTADAPTDRIAVRGLGFRARCVVTVADAGVVLAIAGGAPVFVPARDLVGVGRATWAIDRAVSRDGLVFVRWRLGDAVLDSYLRDPGDEILLAIEAILPATATAATPEKDS